MILPSRIAFSVLMIATLAATVLGGCATTDCSADWYSTGARDGRLGASPQAEYYAARCTSVDRARYLSGWQAGEAQRPLPLW